MIITLSGLPGAGKGTVGRMLAKKLNYQYIAGGDMFRKIARDKYKMTMDEFDKFLTKNPEIKVDEEIDNLQKNLGKTKNNFILDSRLGWFFIPHSFKILLKADLDERVRRITNDKSGHRIAFRQGTFSEIKKRTQEREKNHQKRIERLYGIKNMVDDNHFDLVVDTNQISPQEVVDIILNNIRK